MEPETARRGIEIGIELVDRLAGEGVDLLAIGEMGIGNTTASSALAAVLLGKPPEEVTGRGTGVDDEGWRHKVDAIGRSLAANPIAPGNPLAVLAALGGFEIAGLTGLVLGAATRRIPVLLDGFITGVAALLAARLSSASADYLIASHRSSESGHGPVLEALGLVPLLDLDLRLGEGSGAALALPLVGAALAILEGMATFEEAGVSDSGA